MTQSTQPQHVARLYRCGTKSLPREADVTGNVRNPTPIGTLRAKLPIAPNLLNQQHVCSGNPSYPSSHRP